MEKYKYIIVDDEIPAHLSVQQYFRQYTNYTCVGTFYSPKKALFFLREHNVDLIFLDMEMQEMNGFQFLEALERNIFVVILTAYSEKYSQEAHLYYSKDLVFFSNKAQMLYYFPKIIERFEKMYLEKEIINRVNQLSKNEIHTFPKKVNGKTIPLAEVLFVEVVGHLIVLKMRSGNENIFRISLKKALKLLPKENFLLINRNTIVNVWHVTAFTETTVCINDHHFKISARKQEATVSVLKLHNKKFYQDLCLP